MAVVRTPDERFENLPDFPFAPRYVNLRGLRVHYLDEGPREAGETVLLLHGEPTWSFLYRKMIPPLAAAHRVMALDFIGFGRSDKFSQREAYSFGMHHDTLVAFLDALALREVTLVVHDWGGLIGLTVAAGQPERFGRLVIMNTGLPTGEEPMSEAFLRWRAFAARVADLPIGRIIRGSVARPEALSPEALAGYEAPFPDAGYKAGAAVWPLLVPLRPNDPGAAEMRQARHGLGQWSKPALTIFSDGDPITRGGDHFFHGLMATAQWQPAVTVQNAGHFLQEEKGEEIAGHILAFIGRTA